MYNAPAQYNVRGACININFTHETAEQQKITGEIYGMYDQSHDAAFQERASMVYTGKKLSVDFIYSHNHGNSFNTINSDSHHSLNDGNTYNIATYQREHTRGHNHQIRLSLGYNFTKRHNVNLTYYGAYATSHKRQNTNGSISSDYKLNSEPWTHDISLDYKLPSDTKIGVEYTYYDAPQTQYQNSIMGSHTLNYTSDSRQRLDIWNMYIKQEHALKNGWGLNYGINYKTSKDNSYQAYFKVDNESATLPENTNGHKRENIINIFTGLNKNFNNKIIINASIAAEYYNNTFWNKWNFLPTINTTLIPAQGHILQFSFSSYSTYPEYWAVQNFTRYNNGGYGVITGNPELKPMHEYSTQLTYIIKNKYVLRGWFIYVNSSFMQTLYQNPNELIENIRVLNFDMHQQAGIMASLPLKSGKWIRTKSIKIYLLRLYKNYWTINLL